MLLGVREEEGRGAVPRPCLGLCRNFHNNFRKECLADRHPLRPCWRRLEGGGRGAGGAEI